MARPNRVKLSGEGYYHVIDRIAHKEFLLRDERIKRRLLDLMRRAAEFSGVDVCTYVVMDNHLHLCVHVPEAVDIDEQTIIGRVGTLYGESRATTLRNELERLRGEGRDDEAVRMLDRLRARMGDLSEFMKTFKQRVTQWYNRELGHEGTLWCGRFKSVLLERDDAVRVVANYIHNNPVRARMVASADNYRWSGLGAAVQGDKRAIHGLSVIGMDVSRCQSPDAPARDSRLVNGLIFGGIGFVREMAARPVALAGRAGIHAGTDRVRRRVSLFRRGGHHLGRGDPHRQRHRCVPARLQQELDPERPLQRQVLGEEE